MTDKDVSLNSQNERQPVRGGVEQLESIESIYKLDIGEVNSNLTCGNVSRLSSNRKQDADVQSGNL